MRIITIFLIILATSILLAGCTKQEIPLVKPDREITVPTPTAPAPVESTTETAADTTEVGTVEEELTTENVPDIENELANFTW